MIDVSKIRNLHLEPTTLCNAGCPQCARYLDDGSLNPILPQATLSLQDIQDLLPQNFIQQLDKIFMCGTFGEPAAAKDCLGMYEYFRQVNPKITLGMNTNGSVRTPDWWSQLGSIMSNISDFCVFSLDGLEDTNHIYRKNTQWSKIMHNVEAFIKAGGRAHWDMLVYEHNEHQVDQARQLAKDMGFKWFRVKVSHRFAYRNVFWLKPPKGAALDVVPDTPGMSCRLTDEHEMYMSAHGLMVPCCYIGEQIYGPHSPERRTELLTVLGDLDQYHARHGIDNVVKLYNKVIDTWHTENPLRICQDTCSGTNQPRWTTQWRSEEEFV